MMNCEGTVVLGKPKKVRSGLWEVPFDLELDEETKGSDVMLLMRTKQWVRVVLSEEGRRLEASVVYLQSDFKKKRTRVKCKFVTDGFLVDSAGYLALLGLADEAVVSVELVPLEPEPELPLKKKEEVAG